MSYYYAANKSVQLLVALLKAHGIRRVIISPGTTNMELAGSLQHDGSFELYSCVDERSAAYMAVGMSAESGEPVVISCTEATASRGYLAGLTEAYHRKLPILAVTGLHSYARIGQLDPQVIDRSAAPRDAVRFQAHLPIIRSKEDERETILLINEAILALTRDGGGPAHLDLPWGGPEMEFSARSLPEPFVIRRFCAGEELPPLPEGKTLVLIGGHRDFTARETEALDRFCARHDAVALCDHASRYYGKYRVQGALIAAQRARSDVLTDIRLVVHIGEEAASDETIRCVAEAAREVWRVSPDGEIRDTLKKPLTVFEMPEQMFFEAYAQGGPSGRTDYLDRFREENRALSQKLPRLPFSSVWIASRLAPRIPEGACVHLGFSDTIRAWSFFSLPQGVRSACNSGCRGIDGSVSALLGASFVRPQQLFFGVVGDLTFFYDMNALGNRHVGNNLRMMVVHNDGGNIFRHVGHPSQRWLGFEEANRFICAAGHFGAQSPTLLRDYAENSGFRYLSASDEEGFERAMPLFLDPALGKKPVLLEVFTDAERDAEAFDLMGKIALDQSGRAKEAIKTVLGEQGTELIWKWRKGR